MDYPHAPYNDIEPYNAAPGPAGTRSLLQLARSILLSAPPAPEGPLEPAEIAKLIAVKNTSLTAGAGERWEKSLREVLRSHYCFIAHSNAKNRRNVCYSCDPAVDPSLRRSNGIKRTLESSTSLSNVTSPRTSASSSLPPEPASLSKIRREGAQSSQQADLGSEDDVFPAAVLEIETSDVYERRARGDGRVFYCQKCGPYTLERQRWDGRILTKGLVRLLCGATIAGAPIKALFGLEKDEEWPQTISSTLAREIAKKAQLQLPQTSILEDVYPNLPNDQPAFVERDGIPLRCRYCGDCFSRKDLRSHLLRLEGTCQLEQPLQLASYLSILYEQTEEVLNEGGDSDSDEEEAPDRLARPIVGPAFTAWTELETERFFFALPKFSRFRCDAIAEHIQTKSELEVSSLIELIEENSSILRASSTIGTQRSAPAAREMSDAWVKAEERLAEDVIIWEAFVKQAKRTPFELRDPAQQALADRRLHIHCLSCSISVCDGKRPRCSRCLRKNIQCKWPGPIRPALRESTEVPALSEALAQAYPDYGQPKANGEFSRQEFLEDLTWHQLLALAQFKHAGTLRDRLELLWWKAFSTLTTKDIESVEHSRQTSSIAKITNTRLRRHVAEAFDNTMTDTVTLEEKEAIYKHLKEGQAHDSKELPSLQSIRAMRDLSDVQAAKSRLCEALAQEKTFNTKRSRRSFRRRHWSWSDVPLSYVPESIRREKPENREIQEEVQQAKMEVKAAGIKLLDLGQPGEVFNLRNMGLLLDLYRSGSENIACISKSSLDLLYVLVRKHATRVLALALTIADSKNIPYYSHHDARTDSEQLVKCIKEASELAQGGPDDCQVGKLAPMLNGYLRGEMASATDRYVKEAAAKASGTLASTSSISSSLAGTTYRQTRKATFDLKPLNLHALDAWNGDIMVSEEEKEPDSSTSSESDTDDQSEVDAAEEQVDAKLMEDDRLDDHIYEESLWTTLQGGSRSDIEISASREEIVEDGGSDDEETGADHDSESDTEEELIQAHGRDEDGLSLSDDDSQAEDSVSEDEEPPRKEHRPSEAARGVSRALWAGPVYTTARPKNVYRTQEFISTSDEEEEEG